MERGCSGKVNIKSWRCVWFILTPHSYHLWWWFPWSQYIWLCPFTSDVNHYADALQMNNGNNTSSEETKVKDDIHHVRMQIIEEYDHRIHRLVSLTFSFCCLNKRFSNNSVCSRPGLLIYTCRFAACWRLLFIYKSVFKQKIVITATPNVCT